MFTLQTMRSISKAVVTKKSPYYIQYYINGQCNLMCRQCNIVETNSSYKNASLEEVEKIAYNIKKIGGGIVLLTGGEPFLRDDLPEIVKIFKNNKLDVRLQTAGHKVSTDELIQKTYDAGAKDINVSLDSLIPEKQDYINSVPGSWNSAIETISKISNIYKKSAICSIGCVLSRLNYHEIPSILEFASSMGWYLSLVPVHITAPEVKMGFRSHDNDFIFGHDDIEPLEQIFNRLIKMKNDGYLLFDSIDFLNSSLEFIKTGKPTWRNNDVCDSPFLYFAIRPNGDMMVCCDWKVPGEEISLVDPNFPKIYKSNSLINNIQSITSNCKGCHYGSYPEVTISVRSLKAFLERVKVTTFHKNKLIPFTKENLLKNIENIKKNNKHDYQDKFINKEVANKISGWGDPDKRKSILKEDKRIRIEQNRLRVKKLH